MRQSVRLPTQTRQRGAALLVAIIMLLLVSLLAAGGYLVSTTEARSAAAWSDRQRAMFLAESALREAEAAVREGVAIEADIESAVRNKYVVLGNKGYYVRGDSGVPQIDSAWTGASNGVAATQLNSNAERAYYLVVFEGQQTAQTGTQFGVTGTSRPRFTIYAKAGGIKEGSSVVLSTSQEF